MEKQDHKKGCSECKQSIPGYCYICVECDNPQYFCANCANQGHNLKHVLMRIFFPEQFETVKKYIAAYNHMFSKDGIRSRETTRTDNVRIFVCNVCPKSFSTRKKLFHHRRFHAGNKFTCPECKSVFNQGYKLRAHITQKHSTQMAGTKTGNLDHGAEMMSVSSDSESEVNEPLPKLGNPAILSNLRRAKERIEETETT